MGRIHVDKPLNVMLPRRSLCLVVMVIAACGGSSPVATPSSSGATSTAEPNHVPTSASASRTAAPPVNGPVPSGFEPASYTFVSADQGWVLGTAPCALPPCTSLLRIRDGGRTWFGIPAPRTPLAIAVGFNGPLTSGVSTVRFADALRGWVFGPELWETQVGASRAPRAAGSQSRAPRTSCSSAPAGPPPASRRRPPTCRTTAAGPMRGSGRRPSLATSWPSPPPARAPRSSPRPPERRFWTRRSTVVTAGRRSSWTARVAESRGQTSASRQRHRAR